MKRSAALVKVKPEEEKSLLRVTSKEGSELSKLDVVLEEVVDPEEILSSSREEATKVEERRWRQAVLRNERQLKD